MARIQPDPPAENTLLPILYSWKKEERREERQEREGKRGRERWRKVKKLNVQTFIYHHLQENQMWRTDKH